MGRDVVSLRHRIESVKVIRQRPLTRTNDPEMYPTITATRSPRSRPNSSGGVCSRWRSRWTVRHGSDGRPTSYSASLRRAGLRHRHRPQRRRHRTARSAGPERGPAFRVERGQRPPIGYDVNHLSRVATCRAYRTRRRRGTRSPLAHTRNWSPRRRSRCSMAGATVAEAGELSPFSRTSMTFGRSWPVKPDIVLEGGNLLVDPAVRSSTSTTTVLAHDEQRPSSACSPRRTRRALPRRRPRGSPRSRWSSTRSLWPETVRGLLVHAAEWTPTMQAHFTCCRD